MKIQISPTTTLLLALLAGACGDSDSKGADAGGPDAGGPDKPALGAQIDRMGRPAINTAGNKTFTPDVTRGAAQDEWNANADPAAWVTEFGADVRATIAILDALDSNCGNQLLAGATTPRYSFLATLLTSDMLQVDASRTACDVYLAVEANAAGVAANDKCGGRALDLDVIETSYSVLAVGALTGVDDNIDYTAKDTDTFPYLGEPTN